MRTAKDIITDMRNKKGMSIGFTFIFGLVMLFGVGVLYVVFSQVFGAYLVPTIKNQINASSANIDIDIQNEVNSNIDKYMRFFNILPFVLFGVIVIYMFSSALRKEGESGGY